MSEKSNTHKVSEGLIIKALNSYFIGNCLYKLANAYIFKRDWESDFFVQKQNYFSYEFEIKISRADFFSDKKKITKHLILSDGKYMQKNRTFNKNYTCLDDMWNVTEKEHHHTFRPNKFFYVVPKDMITIDELPKYAGLFYYDAANEGDPLKKIKDAPFIHKEKLRFESVLCSKFYNYWLNAKSEINSLSSHLEYVRNQLNELINKKEQ